MFMFEMEEGGEKQLSSITLLQLLPSCKRWACNTIGPFFLDSVSETIKCFHQRYLCLPCPSNERFIARNVTISDYLLKVHSLCCLLETSQAEVCAFHRLRPAQLSGANEERLQLLLQLNTARPFEDTPMTGLPDPFPTPTDCSGSCLICQRLSLNLTARNGHKTTDVAD